MVTLPRSVNLMALPTRLSRICRTRVSSISSSGGQVVSAGDAQLDALGLGLDAEQVGDLLDQGGDGAGLRVEVEMAGIKARMVEDVVDQAEQVLARRMDAGGVALEVGLMGKQVAQQGREADDAGQRRAQFVAHGGQEVGLGLGGGVGFQAGAGERRLGGLLLADVAHRVLEARYPAVRGDDGRGVGFPATRRGRPCDGRGTGCAGCRCHAPPLT